MSETQTSVFISYSRADSAFVDRLEADLQAHSFYVWVDLRKLEGGQDWLEELENAIQRCSVLLVIISPEAVASKYVRREYRYAQQLGKHVIPLEYRPIELWPMNLNDIQWIKFKNYDQGLMELLKVLSYIEVKAQGQQGNPSTVKGVQVPVAGQLGRYVTGPLPMQLLIQEEQFAPKKAVKLWMKIVAVVMVVALVVVVAGVTGAVLFAHAQSGTKATNSQLTTNGTPNVKATATAIAQVAATAQANIIVEDHLDRNINGWLTAPANVYAFKDGAYHITDRGSNGRATVLESSSFTGQLSYALTMQEVNGDDASLNNSFGMIFRFSQNTKGNTSVTTFYSFEVVNTKNGEYQFWKYDDSKGVKNAWTRIWHANFGKEFHQGHGAQASNTFRVFM